MTKPVWRKVASVVVKAEEARPWIMGVDFINGPRQLRIRTGTLDNDGNFVTSSGTWTLQDKVSCEADGLLPPSTERRLLDTAPRGALICKIGGSKVDLPTAVDPPAPGDRWGGRKVVAIGSFAVVPLGKDDAGPIYFAMNDSVDAEGHSGVLTVLIEEAVL